MAGNVPQHAHCHMCGKSIPYGETLCSEECKQKFQSLLRRRRFLLYLMYGLIAAVIVVILVSGSF
jgi:predicted nucleic acid-binding Zn ribbon protein